MLDFIRELRIAFYAWQLKRLDIYERRGDIWRKMKLEIGKRSEKQVKRMENQKGLV